MEIIFKETDDFKFENENIRSLLRKEFEEYISKANSVKLETLIYKKTNNTFNKEDYIYTGYNLLSKLKRKDKEMKDFNEIKELINEALDPFEDAIFVKYKNEQNLEDSMAENPIETHEGIIQCWRCKSKKTFSYELQTRSGDEGMTCYVQCYGCGNKWKM